MSMFSNDDEQDNPIKEVVKEEKKTNKPIVKKKTKKIIINTEYRSLKENSKLIGTWKEVNPVLKFEQIIEFYEKENNYFRVVKSKNTEYTKKSTDITRLIKKDEKYSYKNTHGEYYKISNSGDLLLYDRDGFIPNDILYFIRLWNTGNS